MASLRKRKGSSVWYACFTHSDGTRAQRSTKTRDRLLAQRLAVEWEEAARNWMTEAQARRVLADIHERIHGTRMATPSFKEYAPQWIERKRGEIAPVTHAAYANTVKSFERNLGAAARQPLQFVTPQQIALWRNSIASRSSARTANNRLKILRVLFQTAWRDGLLSDNPAAKVQILRAQRAIRRPFTVEEVRSLLKHANDEWRGMILAGLYTGQRLRDIASLKWGNVDLKENVIALTTSKTGRRQILPIAAPLRAHLDTLPGRELPTAPLFPEAYKVVATNLHMGLLSNRFRQLMARAGLGKVDGPHIGTGKGREATRERNLLSFHSLRHTATSMLKLAGVPEAVARDIIGHDSAEVSRYYTHIDEQSKRSALQRLPDVLATPPAA